MECLGDYVQCGFYPSSLGRPAPALKENKSNAHRKESCNRYTLVSTASINAPPIDCSYGSSWFGCKLPDSPACQQGALSKMSPTSVAGQFMDQNRRFSGFLSHNLHCGELSSRTKDLKINQRYTGSYSRIPRYIDIPVAGRERHDILPMEDQMPLDWAGSSNPVYHYRDQSESPQFWRPSNTEEAVMKQPDVSTFYQRGRKKRVPYTKQQLQELEREYTISKFITKDKRRRIASSTSLSERQVTIWFQNRRVKDKKLISKTNCDEAYKNVGCKK